ncbi:S41 family peptidase [Pedobacter miscanthi]|uniref:Tail specific protease domain-containing protein n=1 Tax=Pedobacter miscanthi TaxID=2259170 RepID=A0A366L1P2_9SPHI|nr:S41 family peptidase [Pedobacter miscanthi]RBQ07821.1 hypothetical protein DRW42_09460 [Pedobacter miscanthi]
MLIKKTLILFLLLFPLLVLGQLNNRQIRNLTAFAKIYGYVQYFHPSDENKLEIWEGVAINGSKSMMKVDNDDELIVELRKIFLPIAPTIRITLTRQKESFSIDRLKPDISDGYKEISWQHLGFNLYSGISERPYKSIRLNRTPVVGNDRNMQIPLTGTYDVSAYRGLKYDFSLTTRVKRKDGGPTELKIVSGKDSIELKTTETEVHHFTGTINSSAELIAFELAADPSIPLSVDKPVFKIIDGEKSLSPQEISTATKKASGKLRKVTFEIIDPNYALYDQKLKFGEYLDKEVVKGVSIVMPLVLLGNRSSTYPVAGGKVNGSTDLNYNRISAFEHNEIRIADVIMLWNILKHSFPYMDDVKINQEHLLAKILQEASSAKTHTTYIKVIERMCSFYNDAHMFISIKGMEPSYTIPISLIRADNKIVVKDVSDKRLMDSIFPGDIILKVNGIPVGKQVDTLIQYVSGSKQKKDLLTMNRLLNGKKNEKVEVTLLRHEDTHKIEIERTKVAQDYTAGNAGYLQKENGWAAPGTYYFDLTRNSLTDQNFELLKTAKSIIFDLRGYVFDQTISTDLVPALLRDTLSTVRFFNPKILYPDLEHLSFHPGPETYLPNIKNRLTQQVIFLTDASAISASESLLGLIKDFKLGTIIGEETAGTNGDVNIAYLPGNLIVYFSGMLFKNSDGSKHHLNGVLPDIHVGQSRKSIENREDLVLKKAFQVIRERWSGQK